MDKLKVQTDWDSTNYYSLNGFNPLFEFLTGDFFAKQNIEFINFSLKEKAAKYARLYPYVQTKLAEINKKNSENKAFTTIWNFFDPYDRILTEISSSDILFEHSFPLSMAISNFVFHLESIESLFLPFLVANDISLGDMNAHEDYKDYKSYIEGILTSDNCKEIICNYHSTKKNLIHFFPKIAPTKITVLNFLDIHFASEKQDLHASGDVIKNRLLFIYPFHTDNPNITERLLNQFLELSNAVLASNSLKHLIPTIINFQHGFTNDYRGIEVIEGPLAKKIYKKLLKQTSYLFIPSPGIHSKKIIDCIKFNIIPILNQYSEHRELGLNHNNSIPLSENIFDSFANYDGKKFLERVNCSNLITSLVARERTPLKPITANVFLRRSSNGLLELEKFSRILRKNKQCVCRNLNEPILKMPLIPKKFLLTPGYLLYGKFNGKYFYTDSESFLSSDSDKTPSKFSEIMQCDKDSFGNVLFDTEELSKKIYDKEKMYIKESIARLPFKEQFKHHIQDHFALFFIIRSLYRLAKRFQNAVL